MVDDFLARQRIQLTFGKGLMIYSHNGEIFQVTSQEEFSWSHLWRNPLGCTTRGILKVAPLEESSKSHHRVILLEDSSRFIRLIKTRKFPLMVRPTQRFPPWCHLPGGFLRWCDLPRFSIETINSSAEESLGNSSESINCLKIVPKGQPYLQPPPPGPLGPPANRNFLLIFFNNVI